MFHSRIATSGLVDITGCHPFRVGQDNRTMLGHNGILFSPDKDSRDSDTKIFAEIMLPRFGSLDSRKKRAKLAKFIGAGNKLVVLTVNPNRRKSAYIINSEMGHWVKGGAWHSNYDYEGWRKYVSKAAPVTPWKSAQESAKTFADSDGTGWPPETARWRYEPWACELCGATGAVDSDTLICSVCDTCQDCHVGRLECTCWYPGANRDNSGQPMALTSTPHIPS